MPQQFAENASRMCDRWKSHLKSLRRLVIKNPENKLVQLTYNIKRAFEGANTATITTLNKLNGTDLQVSTVEELEAVMIKSLKSEVRAIFKNHTMNEDDAKA